MSAFLKHYGQTLALLTGIVAGGACGLLLPGAVPYLRPVGELFINLIFVLVVPLVFFSVALAVLRMHRSGLLGKVMSRTLLVFLGMSVVAAALALGAVSVGKPLDGPAAQLLSGASAPGAENSGGSLGEALVQALSVPDFPMLFSKEHLLALIVFAALLGCGTAVAGEKGERVAKALEAGSEVTGKMMGLLMYAAPVGLGCWFAGTLAGIGTGLMGGYMRILAIYLALSALVFTLVNSLYVLLARGKDGLKAFWKHLWPAAMTAVATASSAVAMPAAIRSVRDAGVRDGIAEAVIPLGTNIHKNGSVMAAVCKIVFLTLLFSRPAGGGAFVAMVIGLALLEAMVLGAVPSGGFTGEIFLCSVLGFPPEAVGIIVVIGTLVDIPATLLNVQGNMVAAVLVDALTGRQGKDRRPSIQGNGCGRP